MARKHSQKWNISCRRQMWVDNIKIIKFTNFFISLLRTKHVSSLGAKVTALCKHCYIMFLIKKGPGDFIYIFIIRNMKLYETKCNEISSSAAITIYKYYLFNDHKYMVMTYLCFCIILIIMFSCVREIVLEYWTYSNFYCNRNRLTRHWTDAVFACVYALMSTMSIEWIRVPGYLFGEKCGKGCGLGPFNKHVLLPSCVPRVPVKSQFVCILYESTIYW